MNSIVELNLNEVFCIAGGRKKKKPKPISIILPSAIAAFCDCNTTTKQADAPSPPGTADVPPEVTPTIMSNSVGLYLEQALPWIVASVGATATFLGYKGMFRAGSNIVGGLGLFVAGFGLSKAIWN